MKIDLEVLDRCTMMGWNNNLADIITIPTSNGNKRLSIECGQITMSDMWMHCETYI